MPVSPAITLISPQVGVSAESESIAANIFMAMLKLQAE